MYIKLITIGKLKYDTFAKLAADYTKQLSDWKLELIEIKESKADETAVRIQDDAAEVAKKIPNGFLKVVLDVDGREFSSDEFAEFLEEIRDHEGGKICFVIGGAYGLPEEFKKTFDMRLSFGKMTFTHEFARVLLLEQIYRAWTILKGKKYHY